MLLKLSARALKPLSETSTRPFVARVCDDPDAPSAGERDVLLVREQRPLPPGFRGYLLGEEPDTPAPRDSFLLHKDFHYLGDGDIVRIEPDRQGITVLFRRGSRTNSLLVTERCDNYCIMCSQPPRDVDDRWRLRELIDEVIPLIAPDTREIGITGGEPALLGDDLVQLVAVLKEHLPTTAVHILSNGRRFADDAFARAVGKVAHPDLMIGIPLYSDLPEEHDYVVQRRGAFDETVHGILNLKRFGTRVELRFVIHRETHKGLVDFARFVARNLIFVDHVALMGLELVGFAKTNADALSIDPAQYSGELREATLALARAGARVSIYNHALCVLPPDLHPFARKSISDWKTTYLEECERCTRQNDCGGFFATGIVRPSASVRAFT